MLGAGGAEMKIGLKILILMFFVSLNGGAGTIRVEATPEEPWISPLYTLVESNLIFEGENVYVWTKAKAPEDDFPVRDCSPKDQEENPVHCRYQYGLFLLSPEDIIYDGNKRLKFVKNGFYITIAKLEGIPLFRKWKLRSNTKIQVGEYFEGATVSIFDPQIEE